MTPLLLLFDVDGTLVRSQGVGAQLMVKAVQELLKRPIRWQKEDFLGNTDSAIIQTLLLHNQATASDISALSARALEIYKKEFVQLIRTENLVELLEGVGETLNTLEKISSVKLGLLTGNLREVAYAKLTRLGLDGKFRVGAFGDDALRREDLPPLAVQRAETVFNCYIPPENIWLIGDTPRDIAAAHANRMNCLALATGHFSKEELARYNPTFLCNDWGEAREYLSNLPH